MAKEKFIDHKKSREQRDNWKTVPLLRKLLLWIFGSHDGLITRTVYFICQINQSI